MDIDRLQTANRVVGLKQTLRAIEAGETDTVFIARDADDRVRVPIEALCKQKQLTISFVDTTEDLGKACGIDVGAAVAAIIS